jgi:hypothetical protein
MASGAEEPVNDPVSGVSLVMPKGWHWMVPGDPAWTKIYGKDDHEYEDEVRDGTMQGFALPLGTPDARLMTLAVYVVDSEISLPLMLAVDYGDTVTRSVAHDFADGDVVGLDSVVLPAGDAYRVEVTKPYAGKKAPPKGLATRDDRVAAYVLWDKGRAYYLVFRGNEEVFDAHRREMACVAGSLQLSEPTRSPVPQGSR